MQFYDFPSPSPAAARLYDPNRHNRSLLALSRRRSVHRSARCAAGALAPVVVPHTTDTQGHVGGQSSRFHSTSGLKGQHGSSKYRSKFTVQSEERKGERPIFPLQKCILAV